VRVVVLRSRADGGFTLVEMLISVAILGILAGAISNAMVVALRTTSSADIRLTESNDMLFAGTRFGDDVQGAKSVSIDTTPKCGTDSRAVVEFTGLDFSDDSTFAAATTVVSYVLRTVTSSSGTTTRQLHRLACRAATATPSYPLTPASDITVVHRLSSTAPVVDCGGVACAAFVRVNLTLQEQSGGPPYTLTGRRRTS
jgi:prepilin-type N-terminal cleavage/methylation domain-containing protein